MNTYSFQPLLEWYFFNKREFPWRTQNYSNLYDWVYQTWVCEVMSQQTLISVVLPKFNQFVKELPDLVALANCSEEMLRYLWSGLGYYARARNLQKGAQYILNECGGKFPQTKKEWLKVPGCGEYTSSIISSICFSETVAAVDGNFIRVFSRLLSLQNNVWEKKGQDKIHKFANEWIQSAFQQKNISSKATPGDFNQAIMDLGATICKKQNPVCEQCPLQKDCLAFQNKIVHLCPPIKPRRETQAEKVFALALFNQKTHSYMLVERKSGFLLKTTGFPLLAQKDGHSLEAILEIASHYSVKATSFDKTFSHQITHHKITGFVTLLESDWSHSKSLEFLEKIKLNSKKQWSSVSELKKQLSSSLDQKVLKILS